MAEIITPSTAQELGELLRLEAYTVRYIEKNFETPQAAAYNPYQNYLEFRHKPKESTGQKRLEESKKAFREERKR